MMNGMLLMLKLHADSLDIHLLELYHLLIQMFLLELGRSGWMTLGVLEMRLVYLTVLPTDLDSTTVITLKMLECHVVSGSKYYTVDDHD